MQGCCTCQIFCAMGLNGLVFTTTEIISRDAQFFSRGGCKCTPLLQQELGTVASRLPLEMHLQGRVTAPPAPENRVHFQPSPAPEDPISRGGRCHQPPLEMRPIFRGGWWHQPPLEIRSLGAGDCTTHPSK